MSGKSEAVQDRSTDGSPGTSAAAESGGVANQDFASFRPGSPRPRPGFGIEEVDYEAVTTRLDKAEPTWIQIAEKYCEFRQAKRESARPELTDSIDPEAGFVLRLTEYFETIGIATLPLSAVTLEHVQGYFFGPLKQKTVSYQHRCKSNLVAIINFARKYSLCDLAFQTPIPALPKYNRRSRVNKQLDDETISLFIELAPPHARLFFFALFTLGLRAGELLFAKRTPMSEAEPGKSGLCLDRGKERLFLAITKEGHPLERVLPPDLAEVIRVAVAARADSYDALFLTDKKRPYSRGRTEHGFKFKNAWRATRKRVVVELECRRHAAQELNDVTGADRYASEALKASKATGHWGRHTMISRAVERGLPDRMIMELSGHRDAAMIGRYTHLRDDSVRKAAGMVAVAPGKLQSPLAK